MKSPNIKNVYRSHLITFLNVFYPYEVNTKNLAEYCDKYFSEQRDRQGDMEKYFIIIKDRPPIAVRGRLSIIKLFLRKNQVKLDEEFWEDLAGNIKGSMPWTMDRIPTNDELKRIIRFMPLHGKCLYVMLSSSGMRIGGGMSLSIGDIKLDKLPARIIRSSKMTKTKKHIVVFISSEAVDLLKGWLKHRERYLEEASPKYETIRKAREKKFKVEEEPINRDYSDLVFPFLISVAHCFSNDLPCFYSSLLEPTLRDQYDYHAFFVPLEIENATKSQATINHYHTSR